MDELKYISSPEFFFSLYLDFKNFLFAIFKPKLFLNQSKTADPLRFGLTVLYCMFKMIIQWKQEKCQNFLTSFRFNKLHTFLFCDYESVLNNITSRTYLNTIIKCQNINCKKLFEIHIFDDKFLFYMKSKLRINQYSVLFRICKVKSEQKIIFYLTLLIRLYLYGRFI